MCSYRSMILLVWLQCDITWILKSSLSKLKYTPINKLI